METPKYLYHYTSVDVLCKLFTNLKEGNLIFHASSVHSMNDCAEYRIAEDNCCDKVEEIIMEHELGIPFALCFSESEGNIPMWDMYANHGKGVCLRFNFEKLYHYVCELTDKDEKKIVLSKCEYKDVEFQERYKPLNLDGVYPNTTELCKQMMASAFVKPKCFCHEVEWRLMVWQSWKPDEYHKILFKVIQDELCPYVDISIPSACIDGIILRPNANARLFEDVKLLLANYVGNYIQIEKAEISLKV